MVPEALFHSTHKGLAKVQYYQSSMQREKSSQSAPRARRGVLVFYIHLGRGHASTKGPALFLQWHSCCTKDIYFCVLFLVFHQANPISSAAGLAMAYHTYHLENHPQSPKVMREEETHLSGQVLSLRNRTIS